MLMLLNTLGYLVLLIASQGFADDPSYDEVLRRLDSCNHRNKDLNDTINDIQEEMEDMKQYIVRNEERITEVSSRVTLMSKDIMDLNDDIDTVSTSLTETISAVNTSLGTSVDKNSEDISSLSSSVSKNDEEIGQLSITVEENHQRTDYNRYKIGGLSQYGRWCGFRTYIGGEEDNSVIYYESMFLSNTNMNMTTAPLDIDTGKTKFLEAFLLNW